MKISMSDSRVWRLQTPLESEDVIEKIKINDMVYLTGTIYTARDLAHLRIKKLLDENQSIPFDLKNSCIYHAGPIALQTKYGWTIDVLGPTTSMRMEPYVEMIGKLGVKIIVGKGGMSDKVLDLMKTHRMIYLNAPPGCGVIGSKFIVKVQNVYWLDLGMPEAVWELVVKDWGPLVVAMDSHKNNLFSIIKQQAYERLHQLYP
jgi:fumarate hydratase subunit beta/L(+)-tartrate dehydratase beta subunit